MRQEKAWNQNHAFTEKLLKKREFREQVDLQQILLTKPRGQAGLEELRKLVVS